MMTTMAAFIISAITSFVNLFHYLRDKAFASPLMDKLLVIDMRNLWPYSVSIHHNAVRATDFQKIAPVRIGASYHERVAKGLVLLDPGFKNTAACESHIVYMYFPVPKKYAVDHVNLTRYIVMVTAVLCNTANTPLAIFSPSTTMKKLFIC